MQRLDSLSPDRRLYFDEGICAVTDPNEAPETLYGNACNLIQGYYFAKPMPVSEVEKKAFSEEA